jgi:transcriptional regulator with XRE-family HTH domain
MTTTVPKTIELPPEGAELVPVFIDPELVVLPDDQPVPTAAMVADLLESVRVQGQRIPGWICPSPELPEPRRLLIEGRHRWVVAKILGRPFLAFDHGRFVPEEERIRHIFSDNYLRRRMSREEIAERAARWLEITGATQAEAAKVLGVSGATLSRVFGDRRIPESLKPKADLLGLSIRSLVAAAPAALMSQAVEFALTPRADGKKPTRDQVSAFIQQLKKQGNSQAKGHKPRVIDLRINGRAVTLAICERDSAGIVAEDLKALAAGLVKHASVAPDGWPFLFQ